MSRFRYELIFASVFLVLVITPQIIQFSSGQVESVNLSNTSGESIRVQLLVDGNNVYTVWSDDSVGGIDDVFFTKSNDGGRVFDLPINLSQNEGSSAFPRLAVSESNVYVTWYDYSPGQSDIFFAKSNDGGKSFDVTNISDTPMPSYNPWIAAFSNYVYIVFNDGGRSAILELPDGTTRVVDISTGDEELVILVSQDFGETFEFTNLSNSKNKFSWNARLKISDSKVFVSWNEMVTNQSDVFFSKSSDYGTSFSKPINLSNSTLNTVDSAIGVFENNVYVIWNDMTKSSTNIFFAKSEDNGQTFGNPINLSNSAGTPIINRDGSLATSDGNIFLVWYDESEEENYIYFTKSTDEGLTFSTPINLGQSSETTKYAQVVANGKNVYVVWQDHSQGNGEIFLRESNDYGATFSGIKNLSHDDQDSNLFVLGPQIAMSEDRVYSVWQGKSQGSSDLYITSFLQNQDEVDSYYELSTLNQVIDIQVGIDGGQLDVDAPSSFTFRFYDPTSKTLLSEVNYAIEVLDSNGIQVANMQKLFAESGVDAQWISFPESGPFNLIIDIQGIEVDTNYDTTTSGTASIIFTVVPEFSVGIMMTLGTAIGLVVIISYFRTGLVIQKS